MPSELRAYYPSARERTEQLLLDLIAGDKRPSAVQASQVRGIMDVLDFTPVGNLFAVNDAGRMLGAGIANRNPWQIASGLGLGVAAALPFPLARKALRGPIARAARGIDPPEMAMRPIAAGSPERAPARVKVGLTKDEDVITRAAQSDRLFDPPKKPERPFEADYLETTPADAQGRLTHDIEGRPLTARRVVGRNVVGGRDEALPAEEFDTVSNATTRFGTTPVSRRYMEKDLELKDTLGVTFFDDEGEPVSIALVSDLPKGERRRVYAHEIGHVIHELARSLRTMDLLEELKGVFNTLNNPARTFRGGEAVDWIEAVTPKDFGYKGEQIAREYWAEAIRAYLSDPNYLKTVAPKVAAAIRAAVNANPRLNKIIQFNSALAPLAGTNVLSPPDGESVPNTDARKGPGARARTDPSDPRASDRLSTKEWMKWRGEQLGKPRR